jgi:hypothetical protein
MVASPFFYGMDIFANAKRIARMGSVLGGFLFHRMDYDKYNVFDVIQHIPVPK